MVVEGRCAHVDLGRQLVNTQRFGKMGLEPVDGIRNAVALASGRRYMAKANALIARRPPDFKRRMYIQANGSPVETLSKTMYLIILGFCCCLYRKAILWRDYCSL